MAKPSRQRIWVAVRVQRGFISEVKAFKEREVALRQERYWRRDMNFDYDETAVAPVTISMARLSARPRDTGQRHA